MDDCGGPIDCYNNQRLLIVYAVSYFAASSHLTEGTKDATVGSRSRWCV